jgi:hypothetical protein
MASTVLKNVTFRHYILSLLLKGTAQDLASLIQFYVIWTCSNIICDYNILPGYFHDNPMTDICSTIDDFQIQT